jgi:hypothetical protein
LVGRALGHYLDGLHEWPGFRGQDAEAVDAPMRFAAWSSLIIGIGMLAQWALFLATGQVPELFTEPWRIAFHLAAEGATAVALISAAVGLLRGLSWGVWLGLVANGMLVYTAIVSPGYFAQLGQWAFVGMFGIIIACAVVSIVQLVRGIL